MLDAEIHPFSLTLLTSHQSHSQHAEYTLVDIHYNDHKACPSVGLVPCLDKVTKLPGPA